MKEAIAREPVRTWALATKFSRESWREASSGSRAASLRGQNRSIGVILLLAVGLLAVGSEAGAVEAHLDKTGVRRGAQCRYADGTKAQLMTTIGPGDVMVAHRLGKNASRAVRFDPDGVSLIAVGPDGKTVFEDLTDPADRKAFARAFLFLWKQPMTTFTEQELPAFDSKTDVPPCPWKTFHETPKPD